MPQHPGPRPRKIPPAQRPTDVADRALDRRFEPVAQREIRRDRRRQDAAGPMAGRGRNAAAGKDPKPPSRPEDVHEAVSRGVASRDEHGASAERCDPAGGPPYPLLRGGVDSREDRRLVEVGSDDVAEGEELFPERAEAGRREKPRATRGREDRGEDDGGGPGSDRK